MNKCLIIGFSKPSSFKIHAWLIEKLDGSTFDHAYLRFYLNHNVNREIVFQSIDVGVQLVSQNEFSSKSTPVIEYQLDISEEQYTSLLQFCIDNAGKSYSLWGVIGEGLVKLFSKFGWGIKNPFDSRDKTYFCSELVAQCLNYINPSKFNLNADNISPNDLNKLLTSLNMKRVL
jgi:hypothetical protein